MKRRSIGVFSGSFNPIHMGHLMLANYMREFTYLDEVWFVVTPHNPLKDPSGLLGDQSRLDMVRLALEGYSHMHVSDIEFRLPRPSYTVDTLSALKNEYPTSDFTLIIGGDNWTLFNRWKDWETILQNHQLLVYPRVSQQVSISSEFQNRVQVVAAPLIDISSTFIRQSIRDGKNIRAFLPLNVYEYIEKKGLYK